MSTYHNAVSDKLVLFLDSDTSIYQIYSKDNQLKYQLNHHDNSSFPEELSAAIFSSTYLQLVNSKFTLCPLDEEKIDSFFQLNHGIGIDFLFAQNEHHVRTSAVQTIARKRNKRIGYINQ